VGGGEGGRLATHVGRPLRLFPPAVRRLWPISRSYPGTPGVRGPSTGNMGACIPADPGRCKTGIGMFRTGSWLPGQFGLAIDTRRTPRVQERQGRVVCQWLVECLPRGSSTSTMHSGEQAGAGGTSSTKVVADLPEGRYGLGLAGSHTPSSLFMPIRSPPSRRLCCVVGRAASRHRRDGFRPRLGDRQAHGIGEKRCVRMIFLFLSVGGRGGGA